MELSKEQQSAIDTVVARAAAGNRIISLSGPAGTGKTTIIDTLRQQFGDVEICTPTNMAAQVLQTKGLPARTFYRTFYSLEEKRQRGVKPRFIPNAQLYGGKSHLLPEGKRDYADVIIIDEGSMVTSRMAYQMQSMCKTLILVGDHHQLPPVGDNDNPAGYFSTLDHDVVLTEVWRNDGNILKLANEVRQGGTTVDDMVAAWFEPEDDYRDWVANGACSIAFTNKERRRLNHVARKVLGFDTPLPKVGDLMLVTNNYSDDLINGTPVRVLDFQWDGRSPTALVQVTANGNLHGVRMDMHSFYEDLLGSAQECMGLPRAKSDDEQEEEFLELQFGYCRTAHKAQGSEFADVVVFDQRNLVRSVAISNGRVGGLAPDEAVRRWFYTAITRAKQNLAVMPCWWGKAYGQTLADAAA